MGKVGKNPESTRMSSGVALSYWKSESSGVVRTRSELSRVARSHSKSESSGLVRSRRQTKACIRSACAKLNTKKNNEMKCLIMKYGSTPIESRWLRMTPDGSGLLLAPPGDSGRLRTTADDFGRLRTVQFSLSRNRTNNSRSMIGDVGALQRAHH